MSDHDDRLRLIALNIARDELKEIVRFDVYELTEDQDLEDDDVSKVLEYIRAAKVEIPND